MESQMADTSENEPLLRKTTRVLSLPGDEETQRDLLQEAAKVTEAFQNLGVLDRYLPLWIFLTMTIGMLLGNFVPSVAPILQHGDIGGVSIPIGIGLLVMMYPILCQIKFEILSRVFRSRDTGKQILFSLFMNWIISPSIMLGLAWGFLPDQAGLRNGLIIVGIARCIAMVLIWNGLAGGDQEYGAILIGINSLLQMAFFAPMSILFTQVIGDAPEQITTDYLTVARSVAVFLGVPLALALISRLLLRRKGQQEWYDEVFLERINPLSVLGLLFTILVLFISQGSQVVHQIVSVLRVALPMLLYFVITFFLTFYLSSKMKMGYRMACTQSFVAASNNFELAIAVCVASFGIDSQQTLAASVGPLLEVPVLLGFVYVVRGLNKWQTR